MGFFFSDTSAQRFLYHRDFTADYAHCGLGVGILNDAVPDAGAPSLNSDASRQLTKVDTRLLLIQGASVQKTLNVSLIRDSLVKAGLNQSGLAEKLKVSREAVSKWLSGEKFPSPDKLLRLGMLLGLAFEQLVVCPSASAVPVVLFRKKANRKTRAEHLDNARETGELLRRLVKHLPKQELTRPPTLKDPTANYDYVQEVAAQVRAEMGLEHKSVIDFKDLIGKFNQLQAVIVPALWGEQQHHGNALNIFLPDSQTTWVFLNLDSSIVDFKFWIAHELGHSLAPELTNDVGEDFSDSFAQALLFPENHAAKLRADLQGIRTVPSRIARIISEAKKHVISPYTIARAVEEYEAARALPKTDFGQKSGFMGAVTNFTKGCKKVSQILLKQSPPEPKAYAAVGRTAFGSPFFEALSGFCKQERGTEHFIHRVLGVSLADAKALSGELAK
jgi:transcriptional regulator with XRE-family HTH domain